MVTRVYGNIPPEIAYPKDLRKAHDEIQERVEEEENAVIDANIKRRAIDLARYTLIDADAKLLIRPAGSFKEFVKEGKSLSHCVARYAEAHSNGETNIFFIRKLDEPDKPFYTLELKKDFSGVTQNRGKSNCARTPEVERFEKQWLEHVKLVLKKEKRNARKNIQSGELVQAGA